MKLCTRPHVYASLHIHFFLFRLAQACVNTRIRAHVFYVQAESIADREVARALQEAEPDARPGLG